MVHPNICMHSTCSGWTKCKTNLQSMSFRFDDFAVMHNFITSVTQKWSSIDGLDIVRYAGYFFLKGNHWEKNVTERWPFYLKSWWAQRFTLEYSCYVPVASFGQTFIHLVRSYYPLNCTFLLPSNHMNMADSLRMALYFEINFYYLSIWIFLSKNG